MAKSNNTCRSQAQQCGLRSLNQTQSSTPMVTTASTFKCLSLTPLEMCEKLDALVQAKFNEAVKEDPRLKNHADHSTCLANLSLIETLAMTLVMLSSNSSSKPRSRSVMVQCTSKPLRCLTAKVKPMDKSSLIGNGSTSEGCL